MHYFIHPILADFLPYDRIDVRLQEGIINGKGNKISAHGKHTVLRKRQGNFT